MQIENYQNNTYKQHWTKMKFSIKDFFSKCDQIHWKLRIWSHLLEKSLIENIIFCAVQFNDNFNTNQIKRHTYPYLLKEKNLNLKGYYDSRYFLNSAFRIL